MSRQEAYGYAVARIRAMELRLLDAGVMQRMVDAEDTASVLKILGETSYSSSLAAQTGTSDFDKLLESELLAAYSEIDSFVPDKELVALMRLQYDFHNVKVMLKSTFNAKNGGRTRLDLLTSLGSYPVDSLVSSIENDEYTLLPYGLNTLIPQCVSVWEQSKDALEVERLLDKKMYETMLETAQKLEMKGVIDWMRTRIDGENIRTLVRLKRFGFDSAQAMPFLHSGGVIDINTMAALISEPFDSWARAVEFSDFAKVISSIDSSNGFSELILELEKTLDDFYIDRLSIYRNAQAAPENVVSYLYAKEMEIKNVRMILVSKSSNGDQDSLRRLLRRGYA
jgi:V/A-type H+-transporting ATPase subunit C